MDEAKGQIIVRSLFVRYHANETSAVAATAETEVMFFDN
jgi:hypothetical protein